MSDYDVIKCWYCEKPVAVRLGNLSTDMKNHYACLGCALTR